MNEPEEKKLSDKQEAFCQEYVKDYNAKDAPKIQAEHNGLFIGKGQKEWGAEEGVEYYAIKLGNIIEIID